ncbi:MAG TPA: hypothetical protein VIG40_02880 [Tissierellaceae bacterium]
MKSIEQFIEQKRLSELNFPERKRTPEDFFVDWGRIGADEAQRFIPFDEEMPPLNEIVLFSNNKWISEDFNPYGIRIGFRTTEDFITAHWYDYQDCFETISHIDCDDNSYFSKEIRESIKPTHWRPLFRVV